MPDPKTITLPHKWEPRGYQLPAWTALENGVKRVLLFWHRRAGKDDICLHWAATQAMQRVGNYWHMLPEQSQARKAIWNAVSPHTGRRRIDEAFPPEIRANTRDDEMLIRFKNGSTWQVVGSDNFDSLVGSTPIGVVFSEWPLANPRAWAFLRPIFAENGGWSLFIGTPRGKNHAYQMLTGAKTDPAWFTQVLTANQTSVFTIPQLQAELDEYVREHGEGVGKALFAQEYLCSFDSAIVGAIWGDEMAKAREEGRIASVAYDRSAPVHTVWDLGFGDNTAVWCVQRVGRQLHLINYVEGFGKDLAHYVGKLQGLGYVYDTDWLPHDAESGSVQTGKTSRQVLEGLGRKVQIVPKLGLEAGINAARAVLPHCIFDEVATRPGIDCLTSYRWDAASDGTMKPRPLHDWASHGADAFRYLAVIADRITSAKQQPLDYEMDFV
jgi:phage terminase large subunit